MDNMDRLDRINHVRTGICLLATLTNRTLQVITINIEAKEDTPMSSKFVKAEEIMKDMEISRSAAYNMIRTMNQRLVKQHPEVVIVPRRVSRDWYYQCIYYHEPLNELGQMGSSWLERSRQEYEQLKKMQEDKRK